MGLGYRDLNTLQRHKWLAEQQRKDELNRPTLEEMFALEREDEERRADLFVICACALICACFFLAWLLA